MKKQNKLSEFVASEIDELPAKGLDTTSKFPSKTERSMASSSSDGAIDLTSPPNKPFERLTDFNKQTPITSFFNVCSISLTSFNINSPKVSKIATSMTALIKSIIKCYFVWLNWSVSI